MDNLIKINEKVYNRHKYLGDIISLTSKGKYYFDIAIKLASKDIDIYSRFMAIPFNTIRRKFDLYALKINNGILTGYICIGDIYDDIDADPLS